MNVLFCGAQIVGSCTITGNPSQDRYFDLQREARLATEKAREEGHLAETFSYKRAGADGVTIRYYGVVTDDDADALSECRSAQENRDNPKVVSLHLRNILRIFRLEGVPKRYIEQLQNFINDAQDNPEQSRISQELQELNAYLNRLAYRKAETREAELAVR
jgi:hypothetical protein